MALLTTAQRRTLWAKMMRHESKKHKSLGVTKADARLAIDAIDQWLEDNKLSLNSAIPLPARTALTARQKALFVSFVARSRFGVL